MARKPDIQYIGQFYVHGSEAKELAQQETTRRAKTKLPLARIENVQKIYVDPVAICGILVAITMLVVMVFGALQIHNAWTSYEAVSETLNELQRQHAVLEHGYRGSYDLEDIRLKALSMGMIPAAEAETMTISVNVPVHQPEPTWWEDVQWFLDGLFE